MSNLLEWSKIRDDFREGLVLGNGASIDLYERFAYKSLLAQAKTSRLVKKNVQDIFDHLRTTDFERVLRMLWHTRRINKALHITDTRTRKAYNGLRIALARTVTLIHPSFSDVDARLPQIANFMKRFEIVASLNYDLLVYWTMLLANKRKKNRFKDCFIHGVFDSDWERYREPYDTATRSTLIFYPHGNLALARDLDGSETKQTASESSSLMHTITSEWVAGKSTPLFVSEGTSKQKLAAIRRSHYLNTVFDSVLPELGKRVVIFGWSLSRSDSHLLNAICRGRLKEVAISVITPKRNLADKRAEIEKKVKDASLNKKLKVVLFDAKSQECWATS